MVGPCRNFGSLFHTLALRFLTARIGQCRSQTLNRTTTSLSLICWRLPILPLLGYRQEEGNPSQFNDKFACVGQIVKGR